MALSAFSKSEIAEMLRARIASAEKSAAREKSDHARCVEWAAGHARKAREQDAEAHRLRALLTEFDAA